MQQATRLDLSVARLGFFVFVVALAFLIVRGAMVAPTTVGVPLPALRQPATPTSAPGPTAGAPAPTADVRPAMFTQTLTDDDLTRAAASSFPQTVNGVTVSDPVVRVQSGGVRLVANAKVLFGTTQFVLLATPVVTAGRLDVRVDSATVAGFGVPDATKTQIADTMRASVARLVPSNASITSVTLTSGSLTVRGAN